MATMKPSGKTVTHSKPSGMFGGTSVRMPSNLPNVPKPAIPRDHSCKVCPGAKRMK